LLAEWDEMKKLYRGPYIDAFCQDWFQLTDRRRTPSDGNTSHDPLGSGELKIVCFTQTWPLLLKIEHMVKLHVFGNNSKTINNIRNLTG
jgi:hypothetical protein